MSVQLSMAARGVSNLTPDEKFVLIMLAGYARDDGAAWPTKRQLGDDTGLGTAAVDKALAGLLARRLIAARADGSPGWIVLPAQGAGA